MGALIQFLEPFHQLQGVADMGFWRRHQRDAKLRAMAGDFVRCALRWVVIAAALLGTDEVFAHGAVAWVLAIVAALAISFAVLIVSTAAALLIGSRIRTA
jgi:hypothetical protein